MVNINMHLKLCILFGASWLILLCGCRHPDYGVALPGGYQLERTNANTVAIFAPTGGLLMDKHKEGVAVAAKITRIAVHGTYVIGLVVSSPDSELSHLESPGYFVLNTADGSLFAELSEAAFARQLADIGINAYTLASPEQLR